MGTWHKHIKVPQNYCHKIKNFAIQNFDKMCTPNLMKILWTLGRFEKFKIWLTRFFLKKFIEDEDFVCDEHILTKIIPVIEYEKWEIYFKSEVINDIFVKVTSFKAYPMVIYIRIKVQGPSIVLLLITFWHFCK